MQTKICFFVIFLKNYVNLMLKRLIISKNSIFLLCSINSFSLLVVDYFIQIALSDAVGIQ